MRPDTDSAPTRSDSPSQGMTRMDVAVFLFLGLVAVSAFVGWLNHTGERGWNEHRLADAAERMVTMSRIAETIGLDRVHRHNLEATIQSLSDGPGPGPNPFAGHSRFGVADLDASDRDRMKAYLRFDGGRLALAENIIRP